MPPSCFVWVDLKRGGLGTTRRFFCDFVTTFFTTFRNNIDFTLTSKMAAEVRRMLNSLSSSAGSSHKDATGKYREILEKALEFKEPDVTEGLKALVEGGKLSILYLLKFYVN